MKTNASLRLYFAQSAKAKPSRLWHHLSAPALSNHFIKAAKAFNIEQAITYTVNAGYLGGNKISINNIESTSGKHPLCIELIDTEERLRAFIDLHKDEMHHVKAVLFQCELPLNK